MISKKKKVFRSIRRRSLSLCKCRRAKIKEPASPIWPAGRSLPMSVIELAAATCIRIACNLSPVACREKHLNIAEMIYLLILFKIWSYFSNIYDDTIGLYCSTVTS